MNNARSYTMESAAVSESVDLIDSLKVLKQIQIDVTRNFYSFDSANAISILTRILSDAELPSNLRGAAHHLRAIVNLRLSRLVDALDDSGSALLILPTHQNVLYVNCVTLSINMHFDRAKEICSQGILGDDESVLVAQAQNHWWSGDEERAFLLVDRIPPTRSADRSRVLARFLYLRRRFAEAGEQIVRSLQDQRDVGSGLDIVALILFYLGERLAGDHQATEFQKVLQTLDPEAVCWYEPILRDLPNVTYSVERRTCKPAPVVTGLEASEAARIHELFSNFAAFNFLVLSDAESAAVDSAAYKIETTWQAIDANLRPLYGDLVLMVRYQLANWRKSR